ncbi:dynein beta chain, flagellar outer arm [Spizellomyces punctatus DAOM BR117]|uniref:Dynein beta chain, flagellar outer arm n=1 Tax=Spizellomyces punctatus (strain DAOM BR117) TaxID=645134 RepID=A0A0L0HCY7_SPIPD|nr:dynein beta chain, flagellar outer arm [Spizellomyces punctatus DAOM BR117]KNC98871.1 dynein beta chain, flagellar outer arm [Spizellomyces punctatus DAOM BR117]|eukprot:XP_016606911.1 dynein beta chain, flagellar outer arm [Spizellomyces punctatus DAOM BR117]
MPAEDTATKPTTPGKKGKDADADDAAAPVVHIDGRVAWFEEKVCTALKVKNDKWKKMLMTPENVQTIVDFLDKDYSTILFYLTQKEDLFPAIAFPGSLKKKSVYFLKHNVGAPITEKLDTELTMGDLSANPLEFLSVLLEEVYLPLLTNPKNLESWPEVVANDVLRHFHQLNGAVYVISGKSKGKTMLPLPHGARLTTDVDRSVLHTLESAVIDWTHQIKEVIKSSSAAPLEEGLNPGPMVEIDFWAAKAANLKSIYQQLTDEKIQKISKLLEVSKSTYYPAFKMIFDEVVAALDEANDITTYLRALRPAVERLNSVNDFVELAQVFPGMMHTLVLIWRHSKYYNTPPRLTVVLQEICNDIIEQARNFIQPSELFSSEPEEAAERLKVVIRVCDVFKQTYYEYKAQTAETKRPWNFDIKLVFARLDKFLGRVQQIVELFDTIIEFNRLEKIEIGGTKGKILSSQVAQIFTEFTSALGAFSKLKYDVLDLNLNEFEIDLGHFHAKIADLDRRLGTILSQSFDDCSGLNSCFRLLESFAGLLSRPVIQQDFEKKYFALLNMYSDDLDDVAAIFNKYKSQPPIHYNMAPVTGAVAWVHELKDRITKAMEKLKSFNHSAMNTEDANLVKTKYESLYETLENYERSIFTRWSDTITDESETNLQKPLLVREDGLLKVNFDPKVVALLREVRYFEALTVQPPPAAVAVYSKSDVFRKYIFQLDHITKSYNGIRTGVLEVERPLIEERIRQIDGQIEHALTTLNWTSGDIESYIGQIGTSVGDLSSVLQLMKNNLNQIQKIMKGWSANPLVERKDGKKLLNLEEKDSRLSTVYDSIKRDGQSIHGLLAQTREVVHANEESEEWIRYQEFIDGQVKEGFWKTLKTSLEYITQNMESERLGELGPLLEAKLELQGESLVFTPNMDEDAEDSLAYIINDLLEDIYDCASLMGRVAPAKDVEPVAGPGEGHLPTVPATPDAANGAALGNGTNEASEGAGHGVSDSDVHSDEDYASDSDQDDFRARQLAQMNMENETYLGEMRRDQTLIRLRTLILEHVREIMEQSVVYKDGYDQFTWLWTENRQEYMKQFLQTSEKTGDDESQNEEKAAEPEHPSKLEKFENEIRKFESLHKQVMGIEPEVIFQGWFRIDARPLKQALNVVVKKWSYTLTKHLQDDAISSLNELNEFVKINKKGLQREIKEGDYDALVSAMGLLHAIKHRTLSIDGMFEPLRKTINFLRQFGVEMPEETHKLLNDLPEEWSEVKKLSVSIKDHVAPLQAKEVDILQQKCNKFEVRNHNFREEFRKKAPFKFDVGQERAYELIDIVHMDVLAMENEAKALKNSCELFELNVPTYRQLGDCRRDIGMLKSVWDVVSLVTLMFEEWRTTLWTAIDTDAMETRCRDLTKELRRMDKEIKAWDVYSGLDQMVKDMITSLRAVGELRSSAIRDRHWKQLMKTTGVTFVMTADMKFQDLLSLQLHKFEDDVKVMDLMKEASKTPNCVEACTKEGLFEKLENLQGQLALCEKSLAEYLETKRLAFPRFYFVSASDLLDILAKGNMPQAVAVHLGKLFDSVAQLEFEKGPNGEITKTAIGMYSREDEYVQFVEPCECTGPVEVWLNRLVDMMRRTLRQLLGEAVSAYEEKPREQWIFDYPAQITLAGTQIWWTTEVNVAFSRLEEGYENSLKDYYKKQVNQLTALITLIQGELTKLSRQMIMTVCTLDVHARDIVAKLISEKADSAQVFSWQSQLRLRWDEDQNDCLINICDAMFRYNYEYLGNTPRLVVTSLTDRCYITLTQSLHLIMGGAPAGPAVREKPKPQKI